MHKYPHIISELISTRWAITREAMEGILAAVEQGLTAEDRALFHTLDSIESQAAAAGLGNRVEGTKLSRIQGSVGSLFINGPIVPRANALTQASGVVAVDSLMSEFSALSEDPMIREIVLVFDSPGGAVTGIHEFASMVAACSKSVTAYVSGMAASAAYWIASAADRIVSSPTALVGSIGVTMTLEAPKGDGKIEIKSSQSPYKNLDPATKEGRAAHEKIADGMADVFLGDVAKNRGVSFEMVSANYGRGAVLVAGEALAAGMIDKVDTLAGTMRSASTNSDSMSITAAGPKTKEQHMPTLQELIAENPLIAGEVKAIEKAAREDGAAATNKTFKKSVQGAIPYLVSTEYPELIRKMAAQVVSGEAELGTLIGAVAVFDALSAKGGESKAVEDSEAQPDAAASTESKLSDDGQIRSTADLDLEIMRLRGEVE